MFRDFAGHGWIRPQSTAFSCNVCMSNITRFLVHPSYLVLYLAVLQGLLSRAGNTPRDVISQPQGKYTHVLTPRDKIESPTRRFLNCGGEVLGKSHVDTRRRYKLHGERPPVRLGLRPSSSDDSTIHRATRPQKIRCHQV